MTVVLDEIPTSWPTINERGYEIPNEPFGTVSFFSHLAIALPLSGKLTIIQLKPIKVIAIGAGISGISLAHAVSTQGPLIDLKIYELGDDVGS
jgi:hypothetical protein